MHNYARLEANPLLVAKEVGGSESTMFSGFENIYLEETSRDSFHCSASAKSFVNFGRETLLLHIFMTMKLTQ